jgi:two-component system, NtrC family, nitrogen regulation sensor histidine kinase NtrY
MTSVDQKMKVIMKKTRKSMSIRAKLAGAFMIVSLVLMIAVLYLLNLRIPASFDELAQSRVTSALGGIRSEYVALVESTRERTETIARDRFLIEDVASYYMFPPDTIERVEAIHKTSGLDILEVIGARSVILADGANPARSGEFADDPFARDAFTRNEQQILLRRVNAGDRKNVAVVVYDPVKYMGAPIAVLMGGVYMDEQYVRKLRRLASARVVLFEGERATVCSEPGDPEKCLPVGSDFLRQLVAHPDSIERVRVGRDEFMAGGVPLNDPNTNRPMGFLVIGVSRESVNRIVGQTRKDIFVITLVGIVISLVLAVVLSVGITRPISALVRSARLIGRGEFAGAEIPVRSLDELGLLAETMNKMAKDLRDYSERLAMNERNAAWREIARRIAHEIKNPLSPIQLSIENLKAAFDADRPSFDGMFDECSATMLEEVDKLRRLANEFSEFAQMPEPHFETVDLDEMISNLAKFYAASAPRGVAVGYDGGGPLLVRADHDQINRVFTNLIKNAVEAMPGGGSLSISAKAAQGEVFVVFEDTGEGIPSDQLEKIFTPYYTSKSGGTGLGLSIVKRILRDHGAAIDVASEPGRGTRFTIAFREYGGESRIGGARRE